MMAEQLQDIDLELDLLEAFSCFDATDSGYIESKELNEWLQTVGDRMSQEEVSTRRTKKIVHNSTFLLPSLKTNSPFRAFHTDSHYLALTTAFPSRSIGY